MKLARIGGLALLSTFALAACNDANGPSELDQAINEDVAIVAADAALEDLQQMFISVGSQAASGVSFDVPRNFSRTVSFFDAAGNPQDAFNPLTTESIHMLIEMSGAVERDGWTATIARSRDVTVSGLAGEETERTWNGTSSTEVTRSQHLDENGTRSYEMSGVGTIEDVVRGVPRDENPWPLSGTITRSITVVITNGPNGDVTHERTVVITFNGTQFVTLAVNGEEFELDLAALQSDRAVRRRQDNG